MKASIMMTPFWVKILFLRVLVEGRIYYILHIFIHSRHGNIYITHIK